MKPAKVNKGNISPEQEKTITYHRKQSLKEQ